ncbi:hypothetical protein LRP30_27595 [Bradyrhizobium sp. C-145]|uniref:hypothetical protein n=1 Tax=Bradyrhizobium sp. C-145 TaxID=574727 RepID=UPI00201B877C|nr:hypothetical protein [Bradyrhizobium sp. C-145]UQR60749.1 hypothetical protein LRP30_27595 [Bradyrhizobium sp. C-145]
MSSDLKISEALERGYPPAVLYLRNDDVVATEVCAFNYFSIFLKEQQDAEAHIWFFDAEGRWVNYLRKDLGFNGQLQLRTSDLCPDVSGTVAMTLLPKQGASVRPGKKVTTGYYTQYYSQCGAITLSHEREAVAANPFPTPAWMQTYLTRFVEVSGVILVNACLAPDGEAFGTARLRALDGTLLGERSLPSIPSMGARRISTMDLFPDAKRLIGSAETFALEFSGGNMASPFSFYQFANGKFSLHHF